MRDILGFGNRSQVVYWGRFIKVLRETAGNSGASVANRAFLGPIMVPRKMGIDQILFNLPAPAGNVIAGIYADNKMTPAGGSLVLNTPSTPSVTALAFSVNKTLTQGLYWIALMFDGAAASFMRCSAISPLAAPLNGCRYNNPLGFAFVDPCPAVTADNTRAPHAFFRVQTVIE